MFKANIEDKKKEGGGTGANMIHGDTETMETDQFSTPAEHWSIEEADTLMNQGMDDQDPEYKTARINFCFKTIFLQEYTKVIEGDIGLHECGGGKSPERNTIAINQKV